METPEDSLSVHDHHDPLENEIGYRPFQTSDVAESSLDTPTLSEDSNHAVQELPAAPKVDCKPELSFDLQHGYRILMGIMSTSKSIIWPFLDPVDIEKYNLWDYHERIKEPMWLRKMEEKFDNREYNTVTEFVRDFRLMLENCYRYNGLDHWVSKQAIKLERILEQKINLQPRSIREQTTHYLTSNGRYGEDESNNTYTGLRRRPATRTMFGLDSSEQSPIIAYIKQEEGLREIEEKRQRERDKREELARMQQEVIDWEANLCEEPIGSQLKAMWEIPQIGHFLYICQSTLNIGEIAFYELERGFLMPRESSSFAKVVTSLLSTPFQRMSLHKKPSMPYGIWSIKLRERVRQWYKVLEQKDGDTVKAAAQLGIDPFFFKVLGRKFKLDKKGYHELTFYQRVQVLKAVMETVVENHQAARDCINSLPVSELHAINLGCDAEGNSYIHFPHFCGADVRIYRQSAMPDPFAKPPKEKRKKKEKEKKKERRKRKKETPVAEEHSKKGKRKRTSKPATPVVRERPSRLRQRIIPVLKPVDQIADILDSESVTSATEKEEDSDKDPSKRTGKRKRNNASDRESQSESESENADVNCDESDARARTVPRKSAKRKKRHKKQKGKKKSKKQKRKNDRSEQELQNNVSKDIDNEEEMEVDKPEADDQENDDREGARSLTPSSKLDTGNEKTSDEIRENEVESDTKEDVISENESTENKLQNVETCSRGNDTDDEKAVDDEKAMDCACDKEIKREPISDMKEEEINQHETVEDDKSLHADGEIKTEQVKDEENSECVKDEVRSSNSDCKTESKMEVDDTPKGEDTTKVAKTETKESEQDKTEEEGQMGEDVTEEKEEVKPAEEEEEEEEEEVLPEIGPFELVVDGLDSLRELIAKFADPEPEPDSEPPSRGRKKKVEKPPPRKRCEVELHEVLCNLLSELEPWEARIQKAVSRNRVKLKKEWDDFREQPPPSENVEDVWASEESDSSSDDSSDEDSSDVSDSETEAPEIEKAADTARPSADDVNALVNANEGHLLENIVIDAAGDGRPTTRRQARLNKERAKRRARAARAREKKKQEQEEAKALLLNAISKALSGGTTTITLPTTSLGTPMSLSDFYALLQSQPMITVSKTSDSGIQVPTTTVLSRISAGPSKMQDSSTPTVVSHAARLIPSTLSLPTSSAGVANSASKVFLNLSTANFTGASQQTTATAVTHVNVGTVMSTVPTPLSPSKQLVTRGGNTATVTLNAPTVAQQLQIQRMQRQMNHQPNKDEPTSATLVDGTTQQKHQPSSSVLPQSTADKLPTASAPVKVQYNLVLDPKTEKTQTTSVSQEQLLQLLQSPQLTSQQKQLVHLQLLQNQLKSQQVTLDQQKLKLQQTSQKVIQQQKQFIAQTQQLQNATSKQQQKGREQLLQMLPTHKLQLNTQPVSISTTVPNAAATLVNHILKPGVIPPKEGKMTLSVAGAQAPVLTLSTSGIKSSTTATNVTNSSSVQMIGITQQQLKQIQAGQQASQKVASTASPTPQYVLIGGKLIPYASLLQQGIKIQGLAQPQQAADSKQQLGAKQLNKSGNLTYVIKSQSSSGLSPQVSKITTQESFAQVQSSPTNQPAIGSEQKQLLSPQPGVQAASPTVSPTNQKLIPQTQPTQGSLPQQQQIQQPISITVSQSPQVQAVSTSTPSSSAKVTGIIGNKLVTITGIDPKLLAQSGGKLVLPKNLILTGAKTSQPQKIILSQTAQAAASQSPQVNSANPVQQTPVLLASASPVQAPSTAPGVVTMASHSSRVPAQSVAITKSINVPSIPKISAVATTPLSIPSSISKMPPRTAASIARPSVAGNVITSLPLRQIIASSASQGKPVYLITTTMSSQPQNLLNAGQAGVKLVQVPVGKQPVVAAQVPVQQQVNVTPQIPTGALRGNTTVTPALKKPLSSLQTVAPSVKPAATNAISSPVIQQSSLNSTLLSGSVVSPSALPVLTQTGTLASTLPTVGLQASSPVSVVPKLTLPAGTANSANLLSTIQQNTVGSVSIPAQQVLNTITSKTVQGISVPSLAPSVISQQKKQEPLISKPLTVNVPGSSTVIGIPTSSQNGAPLKLTIPVSVPQSPTLQNLRIVSTQNQAVGSVCISPENQTNQTVCVTSPGIGNQGILIQNPSQSLNQSQNTGTILLSPTRNAIQGSIPTVVAPQQIKIQTGPVGTNSMNAMLSGISKPGDAINAIMTDQSSISRTVSTCPTNVQHSDNTSSIMKSSGSEQNGPIINGLPDKTKSS
ncbi:uncharacterized bromodomain-containing protein 10-like [Ptychodera flava]|uniref:uncharacterized bromodomain-containing protein 10-like n=1 Tax=Ptychodera flava TaxID=63121 RepID=UPI003969FC65